MNLNTSSMIKESVQSKGLGNVNKDPHKENQI